MSFPGGYLIKNPRANAGDAVSIPGVGKIPWRRKWQPTPIFLPGELHGQRRLGATVHGVQNSQTGLSD